MVLFALVLVGGGVLCWWAGRLLGWLLVRRTAHRSSLWGLLPGLFMPIAWFAALLVICDFAREEIVGVLGGQESPYFHEHFFGMIVGMVCLLPIVLVAGFFLTWDSFRRSLRLAAER